MDKEYYFNRLYPLQDRMLGIIYELRTGFYLTGRTASSRVYLHHRFSDDIDLFVNDDNRFGLSSDKIIHALSGVKEWEIEVIHREERYVRLLLKEEDLLLKIEMINDVPSHIGSIIKHDVLGMIDSPENILANKVTAAIDRQEPKDIADIWGFCCKMGLSLPTAISDARSKAAGIFPADIARVLCSVTRSDWETVRWIEPPELNQFLTDLQRLGDSLIIL